MKTLSIQAFGCGLAAAASIFALHTSQPATSIDSSQTSYSADLDTNSLGVHYNGEKVSGLVTAEADKTITVVSNDPDDSTSCAVLQLHNPEDRFLLENTASVTLRRGVDSSTAPTWIEHGAGTIYYLSAKVMKKPGTTVARPSGSGVRVKRSRMSLVASGTVFSLSAGTVNGVKTWTIKVFQGTITLENTDPIYRGTKVVFPGQTVTFMDNQSASSASVSG